MRAETMRALRRGAARLLALAALPLLAGCDGVLDPGQGRGRYLASGVYTYDTWSHDGTPTWWGTVRLDVYSDGEVRGTYRLPMQCEDAGYVVDCVGYVGGRVRSDGTLRFGLDEGWLAHYGSVNRYSEVTGDWETRVLGYQDAGYFELLPYR